MYRQNTFIKSLANKKNKAVIIREINNLNTFLLNLDYEYYSNSRLKPDYEDIEKYVESLIVNYTYHTIVNKIQCLNIYLDYIKSETISFSKSSRLIPYDVLNLTDLKRIFRACKDDIREISLVKTLFYTGIRISELRQLNYDDLRNRVFIVYKKNKYREIPIHDKLYDQLIEYCRQNKINSDSIAIFMSNRNNPLSYTALTHILENIARKARIEMSKLTKTHNFRRLFITTSIKNGMNIYDIGKIVGHSESTTTEDYYYLNSKKELTTKLNKYINV